MIGRESLWLDEAASWFIASGDLARAMRAEPTNPPLYYTILFFWVSWLGQSEAAMRSLSVLPSVAGVLVTFFIGRRLVSPAVGLAATAYQAVSMFHIYYAQEVRGFALLSFLLSLSFLCLIAWLKEAQETGRWRYLAAYSILATLCLYTHFISTFFLALHGLYVLICFRHYRRIVFSYAAAGFAVLLAFSPWLLQMLGAAGASGQSRRHLVLKIPQTYFSFLFGDRLVPLDAYAVQHIRETLTQYSFHLAAAMMVVAVISWFAIRALAALPLRQWLPIPILALGPIALAIAVWNKVQLFDERYLIAASPFVYLFVAAGFVSMWDSAAQRFQRLTALSVTAVYAVLLVMSGWNYYFSQRLGREQWREAVGWLNSRISPDEKSLVILDPMYLHYPWEYYQRNWGHVDTLQLTAQTRKQFISSPESAQAMVSGYNRVWLVFAHQPDDSSVRVLRTVLNQQEVTRFPKSNGIEIFHFSAPHDRRETTTHQ
jgi:mannosyltransferase